MNYDKAVVLMLLAVVLLWMGWPRLPASIPLVWLALNFAILSFAYLGNMPSIFGKRRDGTLPVWSQILFLPYRLYSWLAWSAWRQLTKEPASNRVTNELKVGRMQHADEVTEEVQNYVDLTAEFQESQTARQRPSYVAFPILDGTAPPPESLHLALRSLKPGRTFIHCAQGHGRTGLFAAAFLLQTKTAATVEQAMSLIQTARPGIHLSRRQRACLSEFSRLLQKKEAA